MAVRPKSKPRDDGPGPKPRTKTRLVITVALAAGVLAYLILSGTIGTPLKEVARVVGGVQGLAAELRSLWSAARLPRQIPAEPPPPDLDDQKE